MLSIARLRFKPDWPVWALAVAQTLNWAFMFYLFAAAAPFWQTHHGWPAPHMYWGMTLALLASALSAPVAGRFLDRGHGPAVLTFGGLVAASLLLLMPFVESLFQFWVLWALIGAALAFCLYPACFAWITLVKGAVARTAITKVTLVAGFASTLCFPYVHGITSIFGWEVMVWSGALIVIFIACPLSWWGASRLQGGAEVQKSAVKSTIDHSVHSTVDDGVAPHLRLVFWVLCFYAFGLAFSHSLVIHHLVTVSNLQTGVSGLGVLAISLIGPSQVVGRIILMLIERSISDRLVALFINSLMVLAGFVLLGIGTLPGLVIAFALMQGGAHGLTSIMMPLIIRDRLGTYRFGWVSGLLAIPQQVGFALAAPLGASLLALGGVLPLNIVFILFTCAALVSLVLAFRMPGRGA